jgi:dTDP-4-dehydrorhamnose 3,5-epimerase
LDFEQTDVDGALVLLPQAREDERGLFARTVDAEELRSRGLASVWVQCSTSYNRRAGTLRGLHYQAAPHEETKLVRCTRGAIFDVVVDLRPASHTHRRWAGVELSQENRQSLYVPKGCAHGFLTLTDDAEVLYMMDEPYVGEAARGVRWNDPAFGVAWPAEGLELTMSERDHSYPDIA